MKLGLSAVFGVFFSLLPAGLGASDFNASFFGEVPGKPYRPTPEVGDHQESWARQQARRGAQEQEQAPEHARDPIEGPVKPVYERGSTGERRGKHWKRFHESVEAGRAAHAGWPLGEREPARPSRRWPGTNRISNSQAEPVVPSEAEELRDAPAALAPSPNAVSLWTGLSRPMMLPADRVGDVSASQARELGRIDYENKILGAASGVDGAVAASEAKEAGRERKGMRAVVVMLDLADSPGDIWPVLRSLPAEGLKVDRNEKPEFLGAGKTRALVRGWVPAGKSALLLRSAKVLRVEASRKKTAPPGFGRESETELLIGVRIPEGSSPNEAVRSTLRRLGRTAGFRFEKALAYQQIPGSSQLAVVVLGSVAIGNIAGVMTDPGVVKVAPAPKTRRRPPARTNVEPKRRLASFLIDENPAYLPVVLIVGWFLLQAAARKRRTARYRALR